MDTLTKEVIYTCPLQYIYSTYVPLRIVQLHVLKYWEEHHEEVAPELASIRT